MSETIHDPDLYATLSVPFNSTDEANTALRAFLKDVRAARAKHRIADVVLAMQMKVRGVGVVASCATFGSRVEAIALGAMAHGYCRRDYEDIEARAMKQGESMASHEVSDE